MSQLPTSQLNGLTIPAGLAEIAFILSAEEAKKGFKNVTISVTQNSVNISVNLPCSLSRKGGQIVLTVDDYIDIPIRP